MVFTLATAEYTFYDALSLYLSFFFSHRILLGFPYHMIDQTTKRETIVRVERG